MQKVAEFTGKKVEDAVREGLRTLGITLDDADIKIVSNGGLFKKAKVEIRYEDNSPQVTETKPEKKAESTENADGAAKVAGDNKAKGESQKKNASKNEKNESKKSEQPPENEPHWGSAPVKREPTTKSDFGKKNSAAAKQEKETAEIGEKETDAVAEQKNKQPEKKAQQPKERKKEHAERESVMPTEEQTATAREFTEKLIKLMGIEGTVEISLDEGMRVNVNTEDSRIIGHRGEVLDSVQQLISSLINTTHGSFVHVTVDGLGYRARRKETLEGMARRMADKAVRTHRKVTLDAMSSADRRIIHAALGDREDVFTRSEGHEPSRCVAILPKRR